MTRRALARGSLAGLLLGFVAWGQPASADSLNRVRRGKVSDGALEINLSGVENDHWLVHRSPMSERRLIVSFWLRPKESLALPRGEGLTFFRAIDETGNEGANDRQTFKVQLVRTGKDKYKVALEVNVGDGSVEKVGKVRVRKGKWTQWTVAWQASSGADDGEIRLCKGTARKPKKVRSGLANDDNYVDRVSLGILPAQNLAEPNGGAILLDDFEVRRAAKPADRCAAALGS